MIPSAFDYYAPTTLKEALRLLKKHGEDAKLLAGGHSLLPILKARLAQPKVLIDISRILELSYVKMAGGTLAIGAATTHFEVETSRAVRQNCPLLSQVAGQIGDVQVRNKGTIGGSLAHGDPAADLPAAVLALGATLVAAGQRREREIPADEFFVDALTTAVAPEEILKEIRIPKAPRGSGGAYEKVAQRASGFAIVGVAAQVTLGKGGVCKEARVGVTGLTSHAFRAKGVEEELLGKRLDDGVLEAAAEKISSGVSPLEDLFASGEFRAHLARVYTRRALQGARNAAART